MHAKLFISKQHIPHLPDHPDHYVLRPSGQGSITIKEIRALNEWTNFRPFIKETKIALCVDFHTATAEAQNALLKTLEEPPNNTELFLHVDDTQNILATVVSRCQLIHRPHEDNTHPNLQWSPRERLSDQSTLVQDYYHLLTEQHSLVELFDIAEKIAKLDRPVVLTLLDEMLIHVSSDSALEDRRKITLCKAFLQAKELISQNVNIRLALEHIAFQTD